MLRDLRTRFASLSLSGACSGLLLLTAAQLGLAQSRPTSRIDVDQYTIQADRFAEAILHDTPVPTPLTDAVANLRAMEAFAQSAARGGWVSLAASSD